MSKYPKYRIAQITYKSGQVLYRAEAKLSWYKFWKSMYSFHPSGEIQLSYNISDTDVHEQQETAMNLILDHVSQSKSVFKYQITYKEVKV